ncbi:MAG TPA: Lpg1974 family pore-forming outer membrane protein [Nitrospirales bacterium]|nr:Lpg1974 family pore-forming outer membrane protein [Nitrospirales bacterium]
MHVRKRFTLRNISLLSAVAILAMAAFSAPAMAGDPDFKGWYGNLDLALTQPNSLDQHFANHVDFSGSQTTDERLVIDNDDDLTWRLDVGYSWGKKGRLQVSYWQFDNDDSQEDSLNGGVYPTIFGYGTNGGMYIYNSAGVDFEASSSVKATTWDVDYIRPMSAGDKFHVDWLAGLRVADYEETQDFAGTDGTYDYLQGKHIDASSWGFRFGATAVFDFTKMFSMEAGAAFSFLQGETDGDSFQKFVGSSTETNEASDNHIRGQINDYNIKAVWDVGPVDVYAGYSMSDWSGIVTDPVPGNEGGHFAAGPIRSRGRDNISFNSWDVGVRWQFGGK